MCTAFFLLATKAYVATILMRATWFQSSWVLFFLVFFFLGEEASDTIEFVQSKA